MPGRTGCRRTWRRCSRGVILQEVSTDPWIDTPGEVLDVYRLWTAMPRRAVRLEQALQTPAHLHIRGRLAGGQPQAQHRDRAGPTTTKAGTAPLAETGAGQWGSALAMASKFFGLDCQVFMVKASYEQKPYRRIFMETFGAEVVPSPSPTTQAGKAILEADAESTGSLGIAISEAIEVAATSGGAIKYSLGSV